MMKRVDDKSLYGSWLVVVLLVYGRVIPVYFPLALRYIMICIVVCVVWPWTGRKYEGKAISLFCKVSR